MNDRRRVPGLHPNTSRLTAARAAAAGRLGLIPECVRRTQRDPEAVEPVHDLRIALRRADAMLVAFRSCFKPRRWKKLRRRLRRLRRAAAEARAADVHTRLLETHLAGAAAPERPALRYALTELRHARRRGRKRLRKVIEQHRPKRLRRAARRLVQTSRPPRAGAEDCLTDVAVEQLGVLLPAVRATLALDPSRWENLHELRLTLKRFRYSLELLTPGFEPELAPGVRPLIKEALDQLGAINDSHEVARRLDRLADEAASRPSLATALRALATSYRADRDARRVAFDAQRDRLVHEPVAAVESARAARLPDSPIARIDRLQPRRA